MLKLIGNDYYFLKKGSTLKHKEEDFDPRVQELWRLAIGDFA